MSRVAAFIGNEVVPNRMSYAGQVQDRISSCQTSRIGASTKEARPCIRTQLQTYRASTIKASCSNTFQSQQAFHKASPLLPNVAGALSTYHD